MNDIDNKLRGEALKERNLMKEYEHSTDCEARIKELETELELAKNQEYHPLTNPWRNKCGVLMTEKVELEATIKLQLERMEAKENEYIKKEIELEAKLALAEGEWKTYAKSCESLSKKLAEVEGQRDSCIIVYEEQKDRLIEKLKVAVEALEFYNCHTSSQTVQSWDDSEYEPKYLGEIPKDDFELLQEGSDSCNMFLGKRAREALKKIGGV